MQFIYSTLTLFSLKFGYQKIFQDSNIIFDESLFKITKKIEQQNFFLNENLLKIDSAQILEISFLITRLDQIVRLMKILNQSNQLRNESKEKSLETFEWTKNSIKDNLELIITETQIVIKLIEKLIVQKDLVHKNSFIEIANEMKILHLLCLGLIKSY
ncbi:MAG: hypothetical protein CMG08_03450 [Candidatus Marinimicrobia bacterium]|nr:hypothetical protein [Candidatus Neomarinimicrobiota bacterium]|tara:strand:+ start:1782 stop:2255 length:474 start_codon:yes stop_codon:yes gene_type:complete